MFKRKSSSSKRLSESLAEAGTNAWRRKNNDLLQINFQKGSLSRDHARYLTERTTYRTATENQSTVTGS